MIGTIHPSNNYGDMLVIGYLSSKKVTVRFVDTNYETITTLQNVQTGQVKDKFYPSVCGKGYVGGDTFSTKGRDRKAYETWSSMLKRCYSTAYTKTAPTYSSCSVATPWLNYQVFASWFYDNYFESSHLDKDILIKGNKVYSESTCQFVSQTENSQQARGTLGNVYTLKHPDKGVHTFSSQADFCRKHGLLSSGLSRLITKRNKTCKGWELIIK